MTTNLKEIAKKYFRGIYEGKEHVIEEYSSDDIICTYPIFKELFNQSVLQGKESILKFVKGFKSRWEDCQTTFHHIVAEDHEVVVVWSFQARRRNDGTDLSNELQSWGGITHFTFNSLGKISSEIGEESSPGPIGRLSL